MAEYIPDFEKELPAGSTLILTEPITNIEKELYRPLVKAISRSEIDNVIWICYQKVPKDVIGYLTDSGLTARSINKIHYIDMLSNMLGLEQKHENTSYCSSPTEYNCLLRSMEHLYVEDGTNLIIFDNLNALMSYDMIERMIRFIRNLNNLVSSNNGSIIYLGISGGSAPEIEISIHAAMDNVYHLQENAVRPLPANSWDRFKTTSWNDVFTLNAPLMFILLVLMIVTNIILLAALLFLIFA